MSSPNAQTAGSGSMSKPLTSPKAFNCQPLNPRSLAGRRVSRYLAEPSALGNTVVNISNGTSGALTTETAHENRIAEELAKLEHKLPKA